MRNMAILGAILATTSLGSVAHAASYDVQYTAAGSGAAGSFAASTFNGTLTLSDTADADGFFTITGFSGTREGNAATLIPAGGFPLNGAPNDNLFRPTPNYVTEFGFSYTAGGRFYNLFSVEAGLFECSGPTTANCGFSAFNPVTGFSVAPAPGAGVPEPASWAMMLFGFGGLGAVMRRRKTVTTRIRFA